MGGRSKSGDNCKKRAVRLAKEMLRKESGNEGWIAKLSACDNLTYGPGELPVDDGVPPALMPACDPTKERSHDMADSLLMAGYLWENPKLLQPIKKKAAKEDKKRAAAAAPAQKTTKKGKHGNVYT